MPLTTRPQCDMLREIQVVQAGESKNDWKGERARQIQRRIDAVERNRQVLDGIEAELADYDEVDDEELSDAEIANKLSLSRRSRRTRWVCLHFTFAMQCAKQWSFRKLVAEHEFECVDTTSKPLSKRVTDFEPRLKRYLVTTRNVSVIEKLGDIYKTLVSGNSLRVFCVSNKDYWEHRDDPKDEALPILNLSGILSIRKHCIGMVAESQLRIATKYIRDRIPALLRDIELWVQSGAGSATAEQKQACREALDALEARLRKVDKPTSRSLRRAS